MFEELHDRQLAAMDRVILNAEKHGPDADCTLTMSARTARQLFTIIEGRDERTVQLKNEVEDLEEKLSNAEAEVETLKEEADADEDDDEAASTRSKITIPA